MACGILVPRPGIEPAPPALEAQSLNHWTAREAPQASFENSADLATLGPHPDVAALATALERCGCPGHHRPCLPVNTPHRAVRSTECELPPAFESQLGPVGCVALGTSATLSSPGFCAGLE